jgi:hypothetical protein
MATEVSQEIPPKSKAATLTFSETMNHYFATEDALYEQKSRDVNSETAQRLQRVVDALRYEMTKVADAKGVGEDFRFAVRVEQVAEERTFWIRTTASELKDTRLLSLLSASLLLGCAVSFIAYEILDTDWSPALLSGLAIITLGFCLPWFMDLFATREERKLRELRRH